MLHSLIRRTLNQAKLRCRVTCIRSCSSSESEAKTKSRIATEPPSDPFIVHLKNTFKKGLKEPLVVNGTPIRIDRAHRYTISDEAPLIRIYCCGPTVYDESHIGHAVTYLRCDLLRRFIQSYCNVRVILAQNFTDIDDKILARAKQLDTNSSEKSYKSVADRYLMDFLEDMRSLNVIPADVYFRVTEHVDEIMAYIRRLEEQGDAYINPETNDVVFDSSRIPEESRTVMGFESEEHQHHQQERMRVSNVGKKSPRDFVLWKAAKPDEPKWPYERPTGEVIEGRPGWHIECSTLANGFFGPTIDIHFGGIDLLFPHHYSESLCCYRYNQMSPPATLDSWAGVWLHSGHVRMNSMKMSKSLGNVITIKKFLELYPEGASILRMLCIREHYKHDIDYTESNIEWAKEWLKKLQQAKVFLEKEIMEIASQPLTAISSADDDQQTLASLSSSNQDSSLETNENQMPIAQCIERARCEIEQGIADNLDLYRGLNALIHLMGIFAAAKVTSDPRWPPHLWDLINAKWLLDKWIETAGFQALSAAHSNKQQIILADLLTDFRNNVRQQAIAIMKGKIDQKEGARQILADCDNVRKTMWDLGIPVHDDKASR